MSIELKDIFGYLGIADAEQAGIDSIEKFAEKFNGGFVSRNALKDPKTNEYKEFAPGFVGKIAGATQVGLVRAMKEVGGIEFSPDEIKDKKIEDLVEMGVKKVHEANRAKIAQLEADVAKTATDAVKDWETKYNALNSKYSDLDTLHKSSQAAFQLEKDNLIAGMKAEKLNTAIAKLYDGVQWKQGIRDIEKEGFTSVINKNYKFELADDGTVEVLGIDGKRIQNPAKAGTWKTPADILQEEGVKADVWAKNPHKPGAVPPAKPAAGSFSAAPAAVEAPGGRVRKISERAGGQ